MKTGGKAARPVDCNGISHGLARGRRLFDLLNNSLILVGGMAVIAACALIFLFLLYVVAPIFQSAEVRARSSFPTPGGGGDTLLYALEEQGGMALRVSGDGHAYFFNTRDGDLLKETTLLPAGAGPPVAFARGAPVYGGLALGLADGGVVLARCHFTAHYTAQGRQVTPVVEFPFTSAPFPVTPGGTAPVALGAALDAEQATVVAASAAGGFSLRLLRVQGRGKETDVLFGVPRAPESVVTELPYAGGRISRVFVNERQDRVFVIEEDRFLHFYDISRPGAPILLQKASLVEGETRVRSVTLQARGFSLLIGDSAGRVRQWFPARDAEGRETLRLVRTFSADGLGAITALAPELERRGFVVGDGTGRLALFHATSGHQLLLKQVAAGGIHQAAFSVRAEHLLVAAADARVSLWEVHNPHPELSWRALWDKIWYEGRNQPEWVWQSSAASADFEPKFSLTPLSFGTLKAAFYAMLFAIPLAVLGAICTAYFMAPRLRALVKPVIEIMEAVPTVILGFLAGLWFAPFVEGHLPAIFLILLLAPAAVIGAAWLWSHLPAAARSKLYGWEALPLVAVLVLAVAAAVQLSVPLEMLFFDGSMPQWIHARLGLDYDQRNSLVVGVAMGFAVIPTIFSISEDAVFSVPRHLSTGSLALGATRWQTLRRVVLVAALPGVFSAVMIGFGRAVGETMIVIMATGNTPITDWNLFEGFRALSANIAVELPEAEVGGSHYRLLFLSALLLFLVTFGLNTAAELVRLRLRRRYRAL